MPKRENSDEEENVASNASSDQNESDSDQEATKRSPRRKANIESDSNESDNKAEDSDESSDDEKEDLKRKELKKVLSESDDDEKSEKSDKDSDDDSEKSNKSDQKPDDDKSDDNRSDKSGAERSDDEIISPKKTTRKVMSSDSDSSQDSEVARKKIKQERSNDDIEDIFGKMSDDDEEELDRRTLAAKQENDRRESDREEQEAGSQQEEDRIHDIFQQFDEDEEEQVPETETRIDITIPKITVDLGKEAHFVKLPNFLSVDTHPYDPSWYEDEIDEDEICDDEGRARMKLKVENTIRWRNVTDKDGNMSKESNARIVKWSDGSMSLHLGAEIFDIHKQQLLSGDNNHLYIRQGTGLQGQTVFKTKLTFRPHSTDSFTHKKMTLSLADRSQKTQKIRVLPTVGLDPEANRTDRIKKEEDKLRASLRRENKARRVRERVNVRGPTASYLEPDMEDDDEGAISLSAIKNKYKQHGSSFTEVYSDSESSKSSADSIFNKKKASITKKPGRIEESDDE